MFDDNTLKMLGVENGTIASNSSYLSERGGNGTALDTEEEPSPRIRLGNVCYLNSLPYRVFSQLPWVKYTEHIPVDCAKKLAEGELDLGLVPIAECFRHGGFDILEWGIVSRGPVHSVLLVSDSPLEEIDTIYLDPASRSSAALLRILIHSRSVELYERIEFKIGGIEQIKGGISSRVGYLVIGDRALHLKEQFFHVLDLGQWWKEETGYPFVFAAWAGRIDCLTPAERRSLELAIHSSIEQKESCARRWAREKGRDEVAAVDYLTSGVFHFIDHAAFCGMQEILWRGVAMGLFPVSVANRGLRIESLASVSLVARPLDLSARDKVMGYIANSDRLSVKDCLELVALRAVDDLEALCEEQYQVVKSQAENWELLGNLSDRDLAGETVGRIENFIREQLEHQLERPIRNITATVLMKIAKRNSLDPEQVVIRLKKAGLTCLGGSDVSLLVQKGRSLVPFNSISVEQWMELHRLAHRHGLRSHTGIDFGYGESWHDRLAHLQKLRDLQDETGGFESFEIFTSKNSSVSEQDRRLMELIARVYLDNIEHVGRYRMFSTKQENFRADPLRLGLDNSRVDYL